MKYDECPFCSEKSLLGIDFRLDDPKEKEIPDKFYFTKCLICGCTGPERMDEIDAGVAWNKRGNNVR